MATPDERPEVLLLVVDAGGGHRAAARALEAAAEETGAPFLFRVESLETLLGSLDFLQRRTGLSFEEGYNLILRRRWTVALLPLLRVLHALIALRRGALVREMRGRLAARPPAAVVSVTPNFNGVVRDALAAESPGTPFLVLLTDFADFPPRFWIEPGLTRVLVGTDEAAAQARAIGIPPERISRTSGMVLHPRFYRAGGAEARERVRRELGLPGDAFTVTLLFGGKGSPEMEPLAARLLEAGPGWRVLAICGDNPALLGKLTALAGRAGGRLVPVGFTDRVADFLAASDLLVTKPGPGSLAEAFHRRVPVVVTRNRHTIPQERFNARFVEERGLGLVVRHWREIPGAVAGLAGDPERRARLAAAIASLPVNRAVYEAVEIVGGELARARGAAGMV
ncbi:MAG TPA: galactosyldiacylglycerol synthase [Vicinamibacteria bacterium]|nr:galactosyldiacylglycerol synthase [Vicinamibacteria bacterium]